jgi:hypothetical protein
MATTDSLERVDKYRSLLFKLVESLASQLAPSTSPRLSDLLREEQDFIVSLPTQPYTVNGHGDPTRNGDGHVDIRTRFTASCLRCMRTVHYPHGTDGHRSHVHPRVYRETDRKGRRLHRCRRPVLAHVLHHDLQPGRTRHGPARLGSCYRHDFHVDLFLGSSLVVLHGTWIHQALDLVPVLAHFPPGEFPQGLLRVDCSHGHLDSLGRPQLNDHVRAGPRLLDHKGFLP